MAGIIRWRDLQNILTTEAQINLLAGLAVNADLLNQLAGFTGNGAALNLAIATVPTINSHVAKDLSTAHPLVPNTIDGGVLASGTVAKAKLAFAAMDSVDKLILNNSISSLQGLHDQLQIQVQNLYSVLFPSITGDIAQQFDQLVNHIEKLEDAHDASAISFGNEYAITSNALIGAIQVSVPMDKIKFFKTGDIVEFRDTASGPETRTLIGVDYNGGQIGWTDSLLQEYRIANSGTVKNVTQGNIKQSLDRSLRNTTDILTGRLTINQTSSDDALVINKTGLGYTTRFNNLSAKSDLDYVLELGRTDNTSVFKILDSNKRLGFEVSDQGNVFSTDYTLSDRTSNYKGLITKQPLMADRTWTFPNRSGLIGLGDLTFTELLKVSFIPATKQLSIAPGTLVDYTGQRVSAWIEMENPSQFAGTIIDIQARFIADNEALSLGSQWQVFTVYITDSDIVNFFYGPKETTKALAIAEYQNFLPSAYMKLAKIVIQGDGLGGILQSSIEILEDQRPFLTQGMSAAYYEEMIISVNGWAAGTLISIPPNSKAGGVIQTYKLGRGQLEVYIDGICQDVGIDYEETQGEPVGRIRVLKDIANNSKIKFRITFKAAAVTGGFDVPSLQTAYNAGPIISVSDIYGPVKLLSFDTDLLLDIIGSVSIANKIYNLKAISFTPGPLVGDLDKNQLYIDSNSELVFHQYKSSVTKEYNLITELDDAKTLTRMQMFNAAGTVIPKGRAVALHPSMPNAIVLCNASNNLSTSRCIGITLQNIEVGQIGDVVTSGLFKLTGLGIAHNSVVVVDPRNPGIIALKSSVNFLPNDEYMEVGIVDGGHLIVDLISVPKTKQVWKIGIAGESFDANVTKLVRFAINGETRGRVYKADKANANMEQKFWVVAAVNPTVAVSIGDPINLFKIVEIHSSESAFDDQDIGKPLYLDSDGTFKSWRTLNGLFTLGDAAIKIGVIEDRRKFIVDGIQMMGTAPGPLFT